VDVKQCADDNHRADLSFAISSGNPPFFFREGIPWNCFIADLDYFQCSHPSRDSEIQAFVKASTHSRLRNVLKDVHALSCISNLAFQTGRKLSPELYNEIMISILYRLTHLNFDKDDLQEAVRLGLLCFCSTVFMQRQYMQQSYNRLLNSFTRALDRLRRTQWKELRIPMILWLLMLLAVVTGSDWPSLPHWHGIWLVEVTDLGKFDSWVHARESLRSIAWIGFVHDRPGERTFKGVLS
jgi:hypothetical protein